VKKRIIVFIGIIVMLFTSACGVTDTEDNYMTVRTVLRDGNYCYKTEISSKDMKKINDLLLSDEWVFDYNEELDVTSKYKVYSGKQSFYVAPDTDYTYLRVADGDTFEWRKAEKGSNVAKQTRQLFKELEKEYCPETTPSSWPSYVLYRPEQDGEPRYYAKIADGDIKELENALKSAEYNEDVGIELAMQYSIVIEGAQYYATSYADKLIVKAVNGDRSVIAQMSQDSDVAKRVNEILQKTTDTDPVFWCE